MSANLLLNWKGELPETTFGLSATFKTTASKSTHWLSSFYFFFVIRDTSLSVRHLCLLRVSGVSYKWNLMHNAGPPLIRTRLACCHRPVSA